MRLAPMKLEGMKSALFVFLGILFLQGCSDTAKQVRVPARELYHTAFIAYEDGRFNEAEKGFTTLTTEHPNTRLASLATLKLGDVNFQRKKWTLAESNYQQFLNLTPNSHLTPYVLNRIIALNYERNLQGVFFRTREYDRDMEPNRAIIREYQRFFLLYPNDLYLSEVRDYLRKARSDLAEHEWLVGDFYYDREAYSSAIARYIYLLKHYPEYPKTLDVAAKLVKAYENNHQLDQVTEMQKVLAEHMQKIQGSQRE